MVAVPTNQGKTPLPYGFVTEEGEDILLAILDCAISPKAKKFMQLVMTQALRRAGFERDAGNPEAGLWCDFETAIWAAKLQWSEAYVCYIRAQMVDLGMIAWHPSVRGKGRIRANPNKQDWLPLQPGYKEARYTRKGSGRPRKQTSSSFELDSFSVSNQISQNQPRLTGSGANRVKGESGDAHALAMRKKSNSKELSAEKNLIPNNDAEKIIQFVTAIPVSRADEVAPEVLAEVIASIEPKKDYVEEKNVEEIDANASRASLAALPTSQVSSHVIEHTVTVLPSQPTSETKSNKVAQATFGEMPPMAESVKQRGGKGRGKKSALSPEEAERLAQEKATFAARLEELTTIWLAHPRTVKPEQMSDSERRTFYAGMNKLAHSSITSAELPKLLNTMAGWAKGTFIPDPYVMENKLGKLRLEATKGATHAGTTGNQQRAGANGSRRVEPDTANDPAYASYREQRNEIRDLEAEYKALLTANWQG